MLFKKFLATYITIATIQAANASQTAAQVSTIPSSSLIVAAAARQLTSLSIAYLVSVLTGKALNRQLSRSNHLTGSSTDTQSILPYMAYQAGWHLNHYLKAESKTQRYAVYAATGLTAYIIQLAKQEWQLDSCANLTLLTLFNTVINMGLAKLLHELFNRKDYKQATIGTPRTA